MDNLVEHLPDRTKKAKGMLYAVCLTRQPDNVFSKDLVAMCQHKGWNVRAVHEDETHEAYSGTELYPVSIEVQGQGTARLLGYDLLEQVPEGYSLMVEAVPFEGFELQSITLNGQIMEPPYQFDVREQAHVLVRFQIAGAAETVSATENIPDEVYTVEGFRIPELHPGINVVRTKGRSARKVFVQE